jgi:hypothetical protein
LSRRLGGSAPSGRSQPIYLCRRAHSFCFEITAFDQIVQTGADVFACVSSPISQLSCGDEWLWGRCYQKEQISITPFLCWPTHRHILHRVLFRVNVPAYRGIFHVATTDPEQLCGAMTIERDMPLRRIRRAHENAPTECTLGRRLWGSRRTTMIHRTPPSINLTAPNGGLSP